MKYLFLLFNLFIVDSLLGECSDLDSLECMLYSDYCSWNENFNECQELIMDTLEFDYNCIPYGDINPIPLNTTDYADMCIDYLGLPPTVDCGDGVPIPIYVDGVPVNYDQPQGGCDHTDFKGGCYIGSRVGRVQGTDINGQPMPEVIWVYFCRSTGQEFFNEYGIVSVQMIGYNTETGATCFFESPDAVGDLTQSNYLEFDENGLLDGELPAYGSPEFDQAWHSPTVSHTNCISCHTNNPFIHDPWIDQAKLPNDSLQTVVPKLASPDLLYFAVGGYGSQWDNRSIHIEGNQCLSCHRSNMILAYENFEALGHVMINDFMPPYQPGSLSNDYEELIQCWISGPENTDGCDWIIPPGGDCEGQVLSNQRIIIPSKFALIENYPNPFNPKTTIRYNLPIDSFVKITIYDVLGNFIVNLVDDRQSSGHKSVRWNARDHRGKPVSAGVYLYSLDTGTFKQVKKMMFLK